MAGLSDGEVAIFGRPRATIGGSRRVRLSMAAVALTAGVLAWALSARLAGTAVSVAYLFSARSFSEGDGLVSPLGGTYTLYGPLYPVALGTLAKMGMSLFTAARVISVISLGVSAVLAGLWTRRLTGSPASAAIGGLAAIIVWPALMTRSVWPEPIFIAIVLGAGLCLAVAVERRSMVWLVGSGFLMGLGFLTRYAGFVLLLSVVYVVFTWGTSGRARLAAALAFLLPGVLIAGAWIVRNLGVNPDEPLGARPPSTLTW